MVKDEFETTAAYEARLGLVSGVNPQILSVPLNSEYIKYDADKSALNVISYAVQNDITDYNDVFGYGTPYNKKINYAPMVGANIHIVVLKPDIQEGQFTGQNKFGVVTTVSRIKRHTFSLFERGDAGSEELFFSSREVAEQQKQIIASFSDMPPEMAKTLKGTMKAAVVVLPKWPFYVKGFMDWGPPTLKRPTEINNVVEVGIVNFQCLLLTSREGQVLKAVETR